MPVVDEEVSDFAEGFKQDSVAERHGGGEDGEMMSSGNEGVVVCVEYYCFCNGVGFVLGLVEYGSWFLFVFSFLFAFSCVQDRR